VPVTGNEIEELLSWLAVEKGRSANTVAAYRCDWNDFTTWCRAQSFEALPAEPPTVALYITDLAECCKPSTITRRLATISQAHQQATSSRVSECD